MSDPTPARWREVKDALAEALELEGQARVTFLEHLREGDSSLVREVEALLAFEKAEEPLTASVATAVARAAGEMPAAELGTLVGPYRLEAEVGRGGMGAVYAARRADGQYDARVAVKLIRRDMDSAQATMRFRLERQYLASLEHPFIARLLDGGVTADGRLFLVLEYVEGAPIDAFCAAKSLGLEARLELFRKVCSAVEYAHQRLIVHRDLKPSNVLVSDAGTPKLVDFGIAKLLDPERAPEGALTTHDVGRFLTPAYASPEHRAGGPITTASDVYSLGVLLHELLAGCLPRGSPGGQERGDRLSAVSEAALRRQAEGLAGPAIEPRRLRGDVDRIVAKALEPKPEDRYRSVAELDLDLRRFLSGEPVAAREPTALYRVGKWIRRNRALAASLTAAAVLSVMGVAATLWEGRRAAVARTAAEAAERRARHRFEDVRHLAHAVIFDYGDAIDHLSGSIAVRERLVRDALRYIDSLAADAADDAELQAELADAYVKVGDIQGNPTVSNLGQGVAADESYRKAVDLYEVLAQRTPQDIAHQLRIAHVLIGPVVGTARARNDVGAGLAGERRSLEVVGVLARQLPDDPRVVGLEAELEEELADHCTSVLADTAAARAHTEKSCRLYAAVKVGVEAEVEVAYCDSKLGGLLSSLGEHRQAVERHRAAVARIERLAAEHPEDVYRKVDLAVLLSRLAVDLADGDAPAEAFIASERALELMRTIYEGNRQNGAARYRLSQVLVTHVAQLLRVRRVDEADLRSVEALELAGELDAANTGWVIYAPALAAAQCARGEVLERRGLMAQAQGSYRAAAEALGRLTQAPEHLQGKWLEARSRALAAALRPQATGRAELSEALAAMESVAKHDVGNAARQRELARWYVRRSTLEKEPPSGSSCAERPWLARAGQVLHVLEAQGHWLGSDEGLVARGPCR